MSRVALIGQNSIEFINLLIDIWNHKDCAVLINYQTPPIVVAEMMTESAVEKCYIERKYYDKLEKTLDESIKLIPYDIENTLTQLLPIQVYQKFHTNYNKDEAIIIYSSGTTGKSKGIILTHYAINTNADAIIDYMQIDKSDCLYIVKNLTHSSSITGELLVALKKQTPLLITQGVVLPRHVLKTISEYKVTIICVNPSLLSMYCDEYRNKQYDISSLKKIYVSGSILSEKIFRISHELFRQQEIYNVYGLSEAGPRVTAQRRDCCKCNSVGRAIKGVEIVCVNENGDAVANGQRGIIHVKTLSRFIGYVQGEIKHRSLYQDWLNTGDIGFVDEYGELHIVGRADDIIIINAHKIYPYDIEQQIQAISNIAECFITMINHKKEDLLCCLYVSNEEIQGDIKKQLGIRLLKHEIPRYFIRVNSIPKTQNGKISVAKANKIVKQRINMEWNK